MNEKNHLSKLNKDLNDLTTSVESLKISFSKRKKIGINQDYDFDEQDSFDSFTSKFARTSDFYTQKILKTIFILFRETRNSFKEFISKRNWDEVIGEGTNP